MSLRRTGGATVRDAAVRAGHLVHAAGTDDQPPEPRGRLGRAGAGEIPSGCQTDGVPRLGACWIRPHLLPPLQTFPQLIFLTLTSPLRNFTFVLFNNVEQCSVETQIRN